MGPNDEDDFGMFDEDDEVEDDPIFEGVRDEMEGIILDEHKSSIGESDESYEEYQSRVSQLDRAKKSRPSF